MRIIHVEDYFDPTAGYQINELLNASKAFEDEVFLITSNSMEPFHKTVDKSKDIDFELRTGIKIIRLNLKFKISSRIVLKNLHKTIDALNPDVVFFHGIGDFKDLMLWKKKKSYKVIRDCHMSWIASQNKFRKIYYKLFKILFSKIINKTNKYYKIYALGREESQYLKAIGISDEKIDYLFHGYNDENMFYDADARDKIRKVYGVSENEILISYIGKFDEIKSPDLVIDIVNGLDENYKKNINLLFLGPKEVNYMENFNNKIKNVQDQIKIIIDESKPFNELKNFFSASDICIFPKECTLSSIHAQVCNCNVIMEKHESNIERVIDKENLYRIGDINDATRVLKNIIDEKLILEKIEKTNHKLDERNYKNQIIKFMKDIKEEGKI